MFDLTTIQLMNEAAYNIGVQNRLSIIRDDVSVHRPPRIAISQIKVRDSWERLVDCCFDEWAGHLDPVRILDAQGQQDVTLGSQIPVTSLK